MVWAQTTDKAWANQKMNKTPNGRFQFCENKAAISRNPVPASECCMQSAGLQWEGPHFTVIPIVGDGPTQSPSVDTVHKPESNVQVPKFQMSKVMEKQNLD